MFIKNFILIHYDKNDLDLIYQQKKDTNLFLTPICNKEKKIYLESQKSLFYKMIKQLQYYYPKAFIHVLTNQNINKQKNLIVYKKELENNHCCKFLIYDLLDEPAMYLDCDVIIKRTFNQSEIETTYPVKFFRKSGECDFSKLSHKINKTLEIYNAGIVWIAQPKNLLTEQLKNIEKKFFNDKELIKNNGYWPYNDEYSIAYFCDVKNWRFADSQTVNVYPNNPHDNLQSIHYTGISNKKIFLKDYFKNYPMFS